MFEFEKRKLKNHIGKDMLKLLKESNCIVAGGGITSIFTRNDINDIDIYFRDSDSLIEALLFIKDMGIYIKAQTDKAILFTYKKIDYQFIFFDYFKDVESLFNTFDFTVNMGAYDFKTDEFVLHNDFLKDNSQRMIKYNPKTAFPIISSLRVQKYLDKGYTISKPEFTKIMLSINKLTINSLDMFKKQIGGMYGVNYDKVFKGLEGEDFNLDKAIEKIDEIIFQDEYFLDDKTPCIDGIDSLLYTLYGQNEKYSIIKVLDNILVIKDNEVTDELGQSDILGNKVKCKEDEIMFKIGDKVKIKATKEVCTVSYVGTYSIYKGDGYYHLKEKDRAYSEGEISNI